MTTDNLEVPAVRPVSLKDSPMPMFTFELTGDDDALIGCPRCKNGFIVHFPTWDTSSDYRTRPCPYCFKASKMPPVPEED